jgi:hypothetical protein
MLDLGVEQSRDWCLDLDAAYGGEPRSSREDLDPQIVERLREESRELVHVPRVADVVTIKCLEAVGARSSHLCDREGTFPWRAEPV